MALPAAFEVVETGDRLRIAWDNRRVRRDWSIFVFLALFWAVWAPVTVGVTGLCIFATDWGTRGFLMCWALFGWLGTFLIPFAMLQRTWREWVEITPEQVTLGASGWLAPRPKVYAMSRVRSLELRQVEEETPRTLNLFFREGRPEREMLAYWVSPALKEELFVVLERFLRGRDLPVETVREG